jgi:hypothetical protein
MLTLFTTPKAFRGHEGMIQRNALESWKRLDEDVEIVVFGDEEGAAEVCAELGLRREAQVARSASGAKRLDFIFGRAQEIARHELLCYSNCDIIYTKELIAAAKRAREWRSEFLMVGRRWDTEVRAPLDFSSASWQEEIVSLAKKEGIQRFYHNIDYFLFPRGTYREVPKLVIGRVGWDHWLVGRAYAQGSAVLDASDVVCAVHQNHDYGYHPEGIAGVWSDAEARANLELAKRGQAARTIEDAQYRLKASGVERNRWCWLAPTRRRLRGGWKEVRTTIQTRAWYPLLNATRPVRAALGLRQEMIPRALRSKKRVHLMD